MLKNGTVLQNGKYIICGVLGQGGFGITYLAEHAMLGTKVAIKEFFPKSFCDRAKNTNHVTVGTNGSRELVSRYKTKFLKEALHLSKLNHLGIVKVYEAFEENGTAYYVMDYIEGDTVSSYVRNHGAMDVQKTMNIIHMVGSALTYLHNLRITHLDIKPANIILRKKDNMPIIIDFGLAKQYDIDGGQTSTTPVGISHGYAPMEQYIAGGVSEFSPQTDLYALAATMFYLLVGIVPPQAACVNEYGLTFPNNIPHHICDAIRMAMSAKRMDRHTSVSDFINHLNGILPEAIICDDDKTVIDATSRKKPKYRALLVTFCIIFILGLSSLGYYYYSTSQSSVTEIYTKGYTAFENKNYAEALELFRIAADKYNLPDAQYSLGYMYEFGLGVSMNLSIARDWYEKSSDQRYIPATVALAWMYEQGKGTSQNYTKAKELYQTAVAGNNDVARYNLGRMIFDARGCNFDLDAAQKLFDKVENGETVKEWLEMRAKQGDDLAQVNLGNLLLDNSIAPTDKNQGVQWLKSSVKQKNPWGQYYLGECYEMGTGVPQDTDEARRWIRESARQGNMKAQYMLGNIHYESNPEEAQLWYNRSAAQGYGPAQNTIHNM